MDSERDVARAMHRAVDTVPVRPFDSSALVALDRRRSRLILVSAAAAAASVVAVAAVALGVMVRSADETPLAAERCPVPALGVSMWPGGDVATGPADRMVSDAAESLTICRYGGDGPRAPQAVDVAGSDDLGRRVVAALNALPEAPASQPGPECPFDSVALYDLVFTFPDGHAEVVAVNPDGCREAFNGTRRSVFAPASLVTLLDRAVPS